MNGHAWRHHCGTINDGRWQRGWTCAGCSFSVEHSEDVTQYILTEVGTASD